MKKNNFYVYVYLDPRKPGDYNYGEYHFDYEPFYVGKGSNGRMYEHLTFKGQKVNTNKFFINKIKKIIYLCNLNPIIVKYMENLFENVSFELEIKMINIIGRQDLKTGPLCNLTNGGEGPTGRIWSMEQRIARSKSYMGTGNNNYGKSMSEEQKIKISNALQGHNVSQEARKKMSIWQKGRTLPEETKKKMSDARTGSKRTKEQKIRMSLAQRKRFSI